MLGFIKTTLKMALGRRSPSEAPKDGKMKKTDCRHQLAAQNVSRRNAGHPSPAEQLQSRNSPPPQSLSETVEGKCAECKKEKHDRRIYRWKLLGGLCLPYLLASLDLTIVATAVPFIASDFNKFNQLNWIVTSFTLTSTAFIPVFGQLADTFGRHGILQLAMFLMWFGSTLCAAAQAWGVLLLGRALQGMSSAGIMNIIGIILADKVSLKENARNNSIFAFISGASYGLGPLIGGYLTSINWRYCFVLSIPIAFVSHFLIYFLLRKDLIPGTYSSQGNPTKMLSMLAALETIDMVGIFLFIFGIGLIILGTAWGGSTYPWSSSAVVVPIAIGGVLFILFLIYEFLLEPGRIFSRIFPKQLAVIPFTLFSRTDTLLVAIVEFAAGTALYSIFYFIGIFFTLVEAYPASKAGVQLLFYIPGLSVGVLTAMFLCNVWPAQTFWPLLLGTIAETGAFAGITYAISVRDIGLVNGIMVLAGAGTGSRFMPATLHMAGVWNERLAPALSLMRFSTRFGGTLGLTIMGAVFNNKFAGVLESGINLGSGSSGFSVENTQSLNAIAALPAAQQAIVRNAGKDAIMWAFIAIMPILGFSTFIAVFIGNVWIKIKPKVTEESNEVQTNLRRTENHNDEGEQNNEHESRGEGQEEIQIKHSEVIFVPYVFALLKGNTNSYKHQVNRSVGSRKPEIIRQQPQPPLREYMELELPPRRPVGRAAADIMDIEMTGFSPLPSL